MQTLKQRSTRLIPTSGFVRALAEGFVNTKYGGIAITRNVQSRVYRRLYVIIYFNFEFIHSICSAVIRCFRRVIDVIATTSRDCKHRPANLFYVLRLPVRSTTRYASPSVYHCKTSDTRFLRIRKDSTIASCHILVLKKKNFFL